MSDTGIYSKEGQLLLNNIVKNLAIAKSQMMDLYAICDTEIQMNDIEKIESTTLESMRVLGTWNLDKENKTFGDLCK